MEVKIQIPDNCELIKDGDTYIVKEKKQNPPRSWAEFCENYPRMRDEYFICDDSNIEQVLNANHPRNNIKDKNICNSKEEAEAFLALMQLRQLRKAWVGDWKQPDSNNQIGFISYSINRRKVVVDYGVTWRNSALSFPTPEMAREFLDCFIDLCETAKILL